MNRRIAVLALIFGTTTVSLGWSQTKEKPVTKPEEPKVLAPLTDAEKLSIRTPQTEMLQAKDQLEGLQKQADAIQKQMVDAQASMKKAYDAIFASRKITPTEATLCNGPGTGDCEKAPVHDLSLQPTKTVPPQTTAQKEPVEKKQ